MQLDLFEFTPLDLTSSDNLFKLLDDVLTYRLVPHLRKSEEHAAIDKKLQDSCILEQWQTLKTQLASAPLYESYQKNYDDFSSSDYHALRAEVENTGMFLAPGQLLFRGSLTGMGFDWSRPLSTSLDPSIAAYHAYKHWEGVSDRPAITISAIRVPESGSVPVLIGPFGDHIPFGHEYEVLACFSDEPKVIASKPVSQITYVLYE